MQDNIATWNDDRAGWQARYPMQNPLGCVRSCQKPVADVEIGRRSITVSHLANITRELNRKLERDPKKSASRTMPGPGRMMTCARQTCHELPRV